MKNYINVILLNYYIFENVFEIYTNFITSIIYIYYVFQISAIIYHIYKRYGR